MFTFLQHRIVTGGFTGNYEFNREEGTKNFPKTIEKVSQFAQK